MIIPNPRLQPDLWVQKSVFDTKCTKTHLAGMVCPSQNLCDGGLCTFASKIKCMLFFIFVSPSECDSIMGVMHC